MPFCIHELFEQQVEQTPEAVAVEWPQQLTYRQLNGRANQLAHYLRKRGIGPDCLVGICMQGSPDSIVAMLAVLKAGGAYVPLDPGYPWERLAFMLADARTPVLLTEKCQLEHLPKHEAEVVCLDSDWCAIAQECEWNPKGGKGAVRADNLAYVIYTSGSTGRPKGVAVPHQALIRLVCNTNYIELGPCDRVAQVSNCSFDAAAFEIWGALLRGACLVGFVKDVVLSPMDFAAQICDHKISTLFLTTALFNQLVSEVPSAFKGVRHLLFGGEAPDPKWVRELLSHGAPDRLLHVYGPTESTTFASWYLVEQVPEDATTIPIGRSISNTQIYLLDSCLRPVPVGVTAELYIGGDGLARGYLNRAEITAEAFVPHPFSSEPGARLYKTGDLARYLADGNIEFQGRMDSQVKIGGFRIELGEIEMALKQHPLVRHAIAIVDPTTEGVKSLAAFVVTDENHPWPTTKDLREFLKKKLPEYMVPTRFAFLNSMPLTPNGKVDRNQPLPLPNWGRPELEASYLAPITPVEKLMADIWSEVLRIEHVGVHDNFFDLGGHSLLAMKLSSRLSAATKRHISVRSLFLYPSIAALADALQSLPPMDGSSKIRNLNQKHTDPLKVSVRPSPSQPSSPHLTIERRSLLSLLSTGKIPPVDSVALGYLSDAIISGTEITKEEVIHDWYEDLPTLSAIMETSLGRIGIITLPRFRSELYQDMTGLLGLIVEALELARQIGARAVSMTGLIPSATEYGMAVARTIVGRKDLPKITTGHATTAATVVLATNRILMESARDLRQERVGFLGLGSIGKTVLRLMLRSLPHPAEITLCDLYSKLDSLEGIKKELVNEYDFRGPVNVFGATIGLPKEFYHSTLVVGATNVPEVLDLGLVREGTLIVDDSGPHCFKTEDAMRRFLDREDVLFTEGGTLHSPAPNTQLRYLPQQAEERAGDFYRKLFANFNSSRITGCVFSSLLCSLYDELEPTVGLVDDRESLLQYQKLISLGFRATDLQCEGRVLPQEKIRNFHRRFGGNCREQQRSDGKAEKSVVSSEGPHPN